MIDSDRLWTFKEFETSSRSPSDRVLLNLHVTYKILHACKFWLCIRIYTIRICTPCEHDYVYRVLGNICDYLLLNPDLNNKLQGTSIRPCTMAKVPSLQRITANVHTRMHAGCLRLYVCLASSNIVQWAEREHIVQWRMWKFENHDFEMYVGLVVYDKALQLFWERPLYWCTPFIHIYTVTGLIPLQTVSYYTRNHWSHSTFHVMYNVRLWHKWQSLQEGNCPQHCKPNRLINLKIQCSAFTSKQVRTGWMAFNQGTSTIKKVLIKVSTCEPLGLILRISINVRPIYPDLWSLSSDKLEVRT